MNVGRVLLDPPDPTSQLNVGRVLLDPPDRGYQRIWVPMP